MAVFESAYTGAQMEEAFRKGVTRRAASLYVSANETPLNIQNAQEYVAFSGESVTIKANGFTCANGRITYTGPSGVMFFVMANLCLSMDTINVELRSRIGKNGTTLAQTCSQTTVVGNQQSGRRESLAMHTMLTLNNGDHLDVFLANWTNDDAITIRNMQFSVIEL